jgi:hypothetical protein
VSVVHVLLLAVW